MYLQEDLKQRTFWFWDARLYFLSNCRQKCLINCKECSFCFGSLKILSIATFIILLIDNVTPVVNISTIVWVIVSQRFKWTKRNAIKYRSMNCVLVLKQKPKAQTFITLSILIPLYWNTIFKKNTQSVRWTHHHPASSPKHMVIMQCKIPLSIQKNMMHHYDY